METYKKIELTNIIKTLSNVYITVPLDKDNNSYIGTISVMGFRIAVAAQPELDGSDSPTGRLKLYLWSEPTRYRNSTIKLRMDVSIDPDGAGAAVTMNRSCRVVAGRWGDEYPSVKREFQEAIEDAVLQNIPTWLDAHLRDVDERQRFWGEHFKAKKDLAATDLEEAAAIMIAEARRLRDLGQAIQENSETLFPDYVRRPR
jgi:hypothetical protein